MINKHNHCEVINETFEVPRWRRSTEADRYVPINLISQLNFQEQSFNIESHFMITFSLTENANNEDIRTVF